MEPERWGYLPFSLQTFLNVDNNKCQISKINTNLKPFHTCLLRHGVQISKNQSFIASIADLYVEYSDYDVTFTIKEMKDHIINKILTLDKFITYQNGDLITSFATDKKVNR